MNNFTFEETNLLCIYNTGSRTGLIDALTEMRGELSPEEAELEALAAGACRVLEGKEQMKVFDSYGANA